MYEYISGKLVQLTPTYAVVENGGIGYFLNISLYTCSAVTLNETARLLIHEVIREDTHDLYGFVSERERMVFRLLISVSGVGANTARVMLSTLSPEEIETAILSGNVNVLKSIKGIGAKTAQRIIVDLRDKINADGDIAEINGDRDNTSREEALSALIMLGFPKNSVEKVIQKLMVESTDTGVENLVKEALKRL